MLHFENPELFFVEPLTLVWWSIYQANSFQSGTMQNSVDKLLVLPRIQVDAV